MRSRTRRGGSVNSPAGTEPRFAQDVDVAIAVADDAGAETVVRQLGERGYRLDAVVEQDSVGRLANARLVPTRSGGTIVVDVLFAGCGIEPEIATAAQPVELVAGLVVPAAQTGHQTRLQDRGDLRPLLASADDGDMAVARKAIELVTSRGFDRGRDLAAALQDVVG